jgi:thymidine phosphorylase
MDCRRFGHALGEIGGARRRVDDRLDLRSGIDVLVSRGESVEKGQPLAWIRADDGAAAARAAAVVADTLKVEQGEVETPSLILDRIG